ncbi:MAG TPA: MarR family transcriptional regulator [Thermomicrobiales bacterium]|jgi:DNA-binding MarR family transcriptional regulator|nr:MarR family transcriptional regulator [Thermomicrobiales bacterium]
MSSALTTPAGDRAELVRALDDAMRVMSGQAVLLSQAVADRADMHPTDLEALDLLIREGPMPAGRLAARTGLTTGAVTGLVDRLERHGYARRVADPADRRRVIVAPDVERTEADLAPAYDGLRQAMAELCARYTDAELTAILDFMRRGTAIGEAHVARLRAGESRLARAPRRGRSATPPAL